LKRCKQCKQLFEPQYTSLQACCSPKCAIAFSKTEKGHEHVQKAVKRETRELKKKARENDRSWWLKKTQEDFNKYIRHRDQGQNCISCGKPPKKANAGHYRTVGSCPELRFNEDNVHLQCEHCNSYRSGAIKEYREGLLNKIGPERLAILEGPHDPKKYSIDELKRLRAHYKELLRGWVNSDDG